jgi:hypothetical protein
MPLKDPIARAAYQKAYAQKNRIKAYERIKEWRAANPEKWKEQNKKYAKKHKEVLSAKSLRWKKANPERAAEVSRKTRLKNKARVLATKAKYRASKRNKTPIWVDKEHLWLIKQAYELAIIRTKQFGFLWHVDHIIPLNGVNVSGLHVIENMQVIPAAENLLKNNKYEIEHAN